MFQIEWKTRRARSYAQTGAWCLLIPDDWKLNRRRILLEAAADLPVERETLRNDGSASDSEVNASIWQLEFNIYHQSVMTDHESIMIDHYLDLAPVNYNW